MVKREQVEISTHLYCENFNSEGALIKLCIIKMS